MNQTHILKTLKEEIAKETGLPVTDIANDATFPSLGLNSISAVYILDTLEKKLGTPMNPLIFWDYPTVSLFAKHLASEIHHE